ncbi:MAG: hypothetical protein A3G47_00380 [Candidatus Zambryskibacteria bacterium RIFCSPLOWO2_12_FULL_39_45]|uniref:General secretion pathway GspH domain-containing protein n=3 Tax=Candidatus Zambryskiibacteriota TaxID=1817925 RepID=A0A1G2T744_9BACT|nr:MAG: hypothetical protein UT81_C0001G0016 [Parcubacteria group bacterium GW2011_GWA2_40_14]OHA93095.1 MAG: hypothetical protein A2W58_03410 [Candidatus Zambryskibacteria bacterium RIFCSPHIGHO2_02_38_10.5]OHA95685.1 MAG: hypothetical protein A3C63_00390 [Candidatus Zambryskibacteria bacterium RIFCSPHIGHO2_02_FULL_39_82]OHA98591.1 MAG: hypothetical protein A3E32_03575 [Candidatus Zambryskibacteria bacterium RIFCSPHIGHO2_12_FULL_38_37]OHB09207.1 MAG: hypothetical protein A2W64_01545 [Candidatus
MKLNYKSGFTIFEFLIAISIMALLVAIVFSGFINLRKHQALKLDTETIAGILREARSETLASKNGTRYGVHFSATKVTLFAGSVYNPSDPNNKDFMLNASDAVFNITLAGGGSDVIFNRLTGETSQNGVITLSSPSTAQIKTVTVYKTGVVESN